MELENLMISQAHPSWHESLERALGTIPKNYLDFLSHDTQWLPGPRNLLRAFSLPKEKVNYILYGESPYPRETSAIGYAFWDGAVKEIWGTNGFSKPVNRATSLRNFLKMLLIAENLLPIQQPSREDILKINKDSLILTLSELFTKMLQKGFLLLNASLTLTSKGKLVDSQAFLLFQNAILESLTLEQHDIKLLLFGKIAEKILQLPASKKFTTLMVEHPYNISFVIQPKIIDFFAPFHLLLKENA